MRFYNDEKLEIVLKPTDDEIDRIVSTARKLMSIKMDAWILDQLTIDQLQECVKAFNAEIDKRIKL